MDRLSQAAKHLQRSSGVFSSIEDVLDHTTDTATAIGTETVW